MNLLKQKYKILLLSAIICFAVNVLEAKEREIGQSVLAFWKFNGLYYVGTIVHRDMTAKGIVYHIVFEDGDLGIVPSHKVHSLSLGIGSKVLAKRDNGGISPGIIEKITGRALFIRFDDGDRGWAAWSGIAVRIPADKVY